MATNDLVKKKNVSLTPEVHADLMRVVAAIQAKSGVNTTANDAVRVLLEGWEVMQKGKALNNSGCFEYVVGLAEDKPELVDMMKVVQLSIEQAKKS